MGATSYDTIDLNPIKPSNGLKYVTSMSSTGGNILAPVAGNSTNYADTIKNLTPTNLTGTWNSGTTFYPGEDIYNGTDYLGTVANSSGVNVTNNGMGEIGWNQGTLGLGLGTLNWLTNLGLGLYGINQAKKLAQQKLAIDKRQVDNASTSFNDGHVSSGLTALAVAGGRGIVGETAADNQLTNTINSQTRDTSGNRTFNYNASTNKISANA